jgi:hypothetical protein
MGERNRKGLRLRLIRCGGGKAQVETEDGEMVFVSINCIRKIKPIPTPLFQGILKFKF